MVLVVGGLIGGAMLLNREREPKVLENTVQQNEVLSEDNGEVVEDVVEEKVELKKEDISIRIENGAGVPGIAGRTQIFLEGLGYQILDIDNADEVRGSTTLIKIKADKANYQDLLKEDMKDDFTVEVEEDLDSGLEYDVLIVIGADAKI